MKTDLIITLAQQAGEMFGSAIRESVVEEAERLGVKTRILKCLITAVWIS